MKTGPIAIGACLAVLGCALPALAQLHRWVDERGVIHYANAAPDYADAGPGAPQRVAPRPASLSLARAQAQRVSPGAAPTVLPGSPSAVDRATTDRVSRWYGTTAAAVASAPQ